MNKDQLLSLIRSILKIVGASLAAHGATAYAQIVNTEDVSGLIVLVVGLFESHYWHGADPAAPASPHIDAIDKIVAAIDASAPGAPGARVCDPPRPAPSAAPQNNQTPVSTPPSTLD